MTAEHFDVLVVGAGLSGIGAGYHLQASCPAKRYVILEARGAIGGTWDLFRYPGVRSDSDMYTLGYPFRPWPDTKTIADGPSIRTYICETAHEYGIDRRIRFRHRVKQASWSSTDALWTVDAEGGEAPEPVRFTCNFLYLCSGYYRYDHGFEPAFEGAELFRGRIVHPQHWPEDLDYAGKRVIVIGSGATAVTLVPALAKKAAQVTMVQRSPSYVVSLPGSDYFNKRLRGFLSAKHAFTIARWKNIMTGMLFYQLCRRWPERGRKLIRDGAIKVLPPGYPVDIHFKPHYQPWDQRLCVAADSDFFRAIRKGRASIVTDRIETFTEKGIRLGSGTELEGEIIVTATGLELLPAGGIRFTVDEKPIDVSKLVMYKGIMLSDVPNLAIAIGYINASWTLKADLASIYVCRLLNYMERRGMRQCTPRCLPGMTGGRPVLDLSSGYVRRSIENFPKQGSKKPWLLNQNYLQDLLALKYGAVDDHAMEFSSPQALERKPQQPSPAAL
jgi:cation diffusion facilitator CzcD-associated flavoprotein CzcO